MKYGKKIKEPVLLTKRKPTIEKSLLEEVLVDNYGEVIKSARERRGLSRKELAHKLGEKESIIKRIETEQMRPPDTIVKKMERFLNISLKEKREIKIAEKKGKTPKLTIGDVVEVE